MAFDNNVGWKIREWTYWANVARRAYRKLKSVCEKETCNALTR